LVKSLRNTLTAEQFARYDAMARERRAARHRASVWSAAVRLEQDIVLRDAQRRELVALLTNETKPPRRSSPYDVDVLLLQLDRLPREKLKRLFDKTQWERVNEHWINATSWNRYSDKLASGPSKATQPTAGSSASRADQRGAPRAMLTVKQVAARLRISESLVYSWCEDHLLSHYRMGGKGKRGKILIEEAVLEAFLQSRKVESGAGDSPVLDLKHITLR
jgi:excisionase family DNA binding protein